MRKHKQRGFTLIELMVAIVISSIVVAAGISIVGLSFKGLKESNKEYDIENNVRSSLKNVENVIRNSRQIFFVGDNVLDPDQVFIDYDIKKLNTSYLDSIDKSYNYIALVKNKTNNGSMLVNLIWTGKKDSGHWKAIPITAEEKISDSKKNDLYDARTNYTLSFYGGGSNTNMASTGDLAEKMSNKIVNVTVGGKMYSNENDSSPVKRYKLSQDIEAKNVNQIMMSKHLQGGTDDITALAYTNSELTAKADDVGDDSSYAIAFIIDISGSMNRTMDGYWIDGQDPRKRCSILQNALINNSNGFLTQLSQLKVSEAEKKVSGNEAKVQTYFIPFSSRTKFFNIDYSSSEGMKDIKACGIGPYNLTNIDDYKKAVDFINNESGLLRPEGGTNAGEAIMQGLYILKNSNKENKYLVFLSDGNPEDITFRKFPSQLVWCNSSRYRERIPVDVYTVDSSVNNLHDLFYNGTNCPNNNYVNPPNHINKYKTTDSRYLYDSAVGKKESYNFAMCISSYYNFRSAKDVVFYDNGNRVFNSSSTNSDIRNFLDDRGFSRNFNVPNAVMSNARVKNIPMEYIKYITDPNTGLNVDLNRVFLIGFSNQSAQKAKIGFDKDINGESIYAYFKQSPDLKNNTEGDPVSVHDAKDSATLIDALSSISRIISYEMGVFDGPSKAKSN